MSLVNFTSELVFEENLALSAINSNPNVRWAKFIFTDDKPNGNNQRIPIDEFENILRTGPLMPIKMASGKILDGHDQAEPIGVISHLKQEENQILGLAAFWIAEREKDINLLKTMTENEKNPQLSWEVWYEDSSLNDGVEDLHGVVVRASTIVGKPAYKGRTPILAMSSENSPEDVEIKEEDAMDLEEKIKELELMLEQMKMLHDEEMAKMKDELHKAKCDLETATSELTDLRNFKAEVVKLEEEVKKLDAEEAKLSSIRTKFVDAGVNKDDTYFTENRIKLLAMEDSVLEFLVQELAISSKIVAKASMDVKIPNVMGEEPISSNPKVLGRLLRERKIK